MTSLRANAPANIYFIRPVGGSGPIKVGSSQEPRKRFASLLHWSPVDLEIVAVAPGLRACERVLKERFKGHYIRNEWYEPCEDLVALMESVRVTGKMPRDVVDAAAKLVAESEAKWERWRTATTKHPRRPFVPLSKEAAARKIAKQRETLRKKKALLGQERSLSFHLAHTTRTPPINA